MNTHLAIAFGGPEMVVVFLLLLLLFGAKKLPELARGIGQSLGEFKRARQDFEHEIVKGESEPVTKAKNPETPTDEPAAQKPKATEPVGSDLN